jgi:hypothetical protein
VPVELLAWPEQSKSFPIHLLEIAPARLAELQRAIPRPEKTAWATARQLLVWVSGRWQHDGARRVERDDAVHVLERVAAGERFACTEYAIVLSQGLNALGIPARRVSLRQADHHFGVGKAHVVSEAWIDDLGRWVLLDGQNGLFWADVDGTPLGLADLLQRYAAGRRVRHVDLARPMSDSRAGAWWTYFHSASPTGTGLVRPPYVPVLQGADVIESRRLSTDPTAASPDLNEIATGVMPVKDSPALTFQTAHPHATGFAVQQKRQRWLLAPYGRWPIPTGQPGRHTATVATVTRYGPLKEHEIAYCVTSDAMS